MRIPRRSQAMPNSGCRMHGGSSPGTPKGNSNAFKHGRYTAGAVARRREISGLVRAMKALASAFPIIWSSDRVAPASTYRQDLTHLR